MVDGIEKIQVLSRKRNPIISSFKISKILVPISFKIVNISRQDSSCRIESECLEAIALLGTQKMTGRLLERRFKKKPEGDLGRTVRQPIGQQFFFQVYLCEPGGGWVLGGETF